MVLGSWCRLAQTLALNYIGSQFIDTGTSVPCIFKLLLQWAETKILNIFKWYSHLEILSGYVKYGDPPQTTLSFVDTFAVYAPLCSSKFNQQLLCLTQKAHLITQSNINKHAPYINNNLPLVYWLDSALVNSDSGFSIVWESFENFSISISTSGKLLLKRKI